MWIIQFQNLKPKDYNMIKRQFQKLDFKARKVPEIIFIKACIAHMFQKKSWRNLAIQYHCNYLSLYNFYQKNKNCPEFHKIFHTFTEEGILLFIEENTNNFQLNLYNKPQQLALTKQELKNILNNI